ncbi:MAG: Arc family DNA-binding protein, partial [bacterium]
MVSLSIKNVPEELADYLRKRAEENNRSLQGELLTILEESVEGNHTTLDQIATHVESSG